VRRYGDLARTLKEVLNTTTKRDYVTEWGLNPDLKSECEVDRGNYQKWCRKTEWGEATKNISTAQAFHDTGAVDPCWIQDRKGTHYICWVVDP
jgi:hypothetical protein